MSAPATEIKSVPNFRDAGGMPVMGGKRIRSNVIFRSASPDKITRKDIANLHGLGIKTIIDLRAPYESGKKARRIDGIETVSLPLDFEKKTRENLIPLLKRKDGMEHIPALIDSLCLEILDGSVGVFRNVVGLLLDPSRIPLLIHCQAGKDRTGILSALIQLSLDADQGSIISNYMASNTALMAIFRKRLAIRKIITLGFFPADKVLFAVTVRERNMLSVIERVMNHYDGIEGYFSRSGPVNDEFRKLKELYLI
ncbi:MAG: tyrosine-protein phosphatase [Bacteroidota bacterium]